MCLSSRKDGRLDRKVCQKQNNGVLVPGATISHRLTARAPASTGQKGDFGMAANILKVKARPALVNLNRMRIYAAWWA